MRIRRLGSHGSTVSCRSETDTLASAAADDNDRFDGVDNWYKGDSGVYHHNADGTADANDHHTNTKSGYDMYSDRKTQTIGDVSVTDGSAGGPVAATLMIDEQGRRQEEGAAHDPDVEPRKFAVLPC